MMCIGKPLDLFPSRSVWVSEGLSSLVVCLCVLHSKSLGHKLKLNFVMMLVKFVFVIVEIRSYALYCVSSMPCVTFTLFGVCVSELGSATRLSCRYLEFQSCNTINISRIDFILMFKK